MKKLFLSTGIILAFIFPEWSSGAGSSAFQFLRIQPGARASAIGGAYVSLADDGYSLYWNPAGLGRINETRLSFSHMFYLENLNYNFVSYTEPMGKFGVFSLGFTGLFSDKIGKTLEDEYGYIIETDETYDTREAAFKLGWGKSVNEHLNVGITGKIISQRIEQKTATGIGLDMGGKYYFTDRVIIGAGIQNIGPSVRGSNLPLNFKLGVHWLMPDYGPRAVKDLIVGTEINQPRDGKLNFGFGFERTIYDVVLLRAGYNSRAQTGGLTGLRAGLGIKWPRFKVDYSFAPYQNLGNTHQFSTGLTF